MTTTDERGRMVPVTARRPGRCGAVTMIPDHRRADGTLDGPLSGPCIKIHGHDGDHKSLCHAWAPNEEN